MHRYQQILVAVDFSEHSEEAISRALDLAARYDSKIHFLHVTEVPIYPVLEDIAITGVGGVWDEEMLNQLKSATEKKMTAYASEYALDASNFEVVMGVPKLEILEKAAHLQADLIVMGRHGMNGWQKLIGSTTDAVMHDAPCDVLAVRLED